MDLVTLAITMFRRWYVVIPVLAIAALLGVLLLTQPAVRYETYSTDLLIVRSQVEQLDNEAPQISVLQLSSFLASALRQPEFLGSLDEEGVSAEVETAVNPDDSVVTVTANGDDPNDVLETLRAVIDLAPSALEASVGPTASRSVVVAPLSQPSDNDVVIENGRYSASVGIAVLSVADQNNPFPPGGGTVLVITEIAQGANVADAVSSAVPSAEFEVMGDSRPTAPLIRITTTADTPDEAVLAVDVVREQLNVQLDDLQASAGVIDENRTVIQTLVPAGDAEPTSASVVRPAVAIALLGLAAAAALAIAVDTMISRGAQRRLLAEEP
jgi:hypothetical protein